MVRPEILLVNNWERRNECHAPELGARQLGRLMGLPDNSPPALHPHRPDLGTITSADNHRKLKEDGLADLEAAATTGAGHSTLIDGLVHGPHPE